MFTGLYEGEERAIPLLWFSTSIRTILEGYQRWKLTGNGGLEKGPKESREHRFPEKESMGRCSAPEKPKSDWLPKI